MPATERTTQSCQRKRLPCTLHLHIIISPWFVQAWAHCMIDRPVRCTLVDACTYLALIIWFTYPSMATFLTISNVCHSFSGVPHGSIHLCQSGLWAGCGRASHGTSVFSYANILPRSYSDYFILSRTTDGTDDLQSLRIRNLPCVYV